MMMKALRSGSSVSSRGVLRSCNTAASSAPRILHNSHSSSSFFLITTTTTTNNNNLVPTFALVAHSSKSHFSTASLNRSPFRNTTTTTTTTTSRTTSPISPQFQHQPQQQKRTLFIAVEETPNPASLKFFPTGGARLMPEGISKDFPNPLSAFSSPLAKALFQVDGVRGVYLTSDFITVTKSAEVAWPSLKFEIFEAIENFFASGRPVISEDAIQNEDTAAQEEDDEVLIAIKEILETRVRPMVQEDGGDIHFIGFQDGVVKLKMQGSCSGCPSSTATLKNGIENMLKHYVPEVEEVISITDEDDPVAKEQFERTEQQIEGEQDQAQQQHQQH